MKRRYIRAAAWILALLLSLPTVFTGCHTGSDPKEENTSAPETGSLPIETGSDDFENTLMLAADGQTDYTVIVPDYAAAWELAAAERLVATLADLGVTVTPVTDTATEPTAKEIVVGYTNRNDELAHDFYDVGPAGYHIALLSEKLFIGTNTEAGMTAAMDRLAADLISDGNRLGIKEGYVCKVVDESAEPAAPTLSGAYAQSIAYAHSVANGVQGYYTDGTRKGFLVGNESMSVIADMTASGNRAINAFVNEHGIPYLRNTMSAYVETAANRYYSGNSSVPARMNMFRYGAYYYETRLMGQDFGASRVVDESTEPYDLIAENKNFGGLNITVRKDSSNNTLKAILTSSEGSYITFNKAMKLPTESYGAVLLTLKTEGCPGGRIYLAAGSHEGIDGAQWLNYDLIDDGEYHTYIISLDGVADYTGNLTQLRLDLNGREDAVIEIKELKIVKTKSSGVPSVALDRIFHAYPDKLHQELHLVTTYEEKNMTAYGMETAVETSRVRSLLVIDGKGEHTTLDGVDWSSMVAVAFDIDRAGVFGYVLPASGGGQITVTEKDGYYVIDQKMTAKSSYAQFESLSMGHRIYNDATHSFDGFREAVREEQHPLTVTVAASQSFNGKFVGYDSLRGAYRVDLKGTDFNTAYYQTPDLHYRVDVEIKGDSADRNVYFYTYTPNGGLESAVLMDSQNRVLPYTVQVCKNFSGENEEPLFCKGDPAYGEAYFPISVKSGESLSFSVLNLYQNWGAFPLKQISSVQFFVPYYHLSTGVTETNCIAPYYVDGKNLWTLPDFRAMSAPLWAGQPQHTSGGRLYFLQYTDAEGNTYASDKTVDEIVSHGPVYTDIWMNYLSDDGRISIDYRHMEMPQTDENRTYYEIRMKVLKDISFENFAEDFTFFSMDGRSIVYDTLGYLNENNEVILTSTNQSKREKIYKLGSKSPFVSLSYTAASNDYVNLAAVIKDYSATIGGRAYTGGIVMTDTFRGNVNYVRLTLDLGKVTLKAGDEININMILMPWGSQETAKDDISGVLNVRRDTCLDPIKAEVKTGTLIADPYMPQIKAEGETAEFTLSGGNNHMAVRVYGFDSYEKPVIEEYVNGEWVVYNTASKNGYDGYMVHYDGDGTYSFSFIVDMSNCARTFRVKS
ncbi:MAG: hypothetical protein J6J01_10155 [Oscillospiraceae bacterium]|nr:hypothetical protein [Clostridia bacterium]MBP3699822.1 hypothetical protein [Oscillospiraceae bacterium]